MVSGLRRLCEKCCEKEEVCEKATKDNRGPGASLAEDGFGGFPASGGVVGSERKDKKKKKKVKGREEEEGDLAGVRVRNYCKKLVGNRAGVPVKLIPTQRLGGEDGADRGFVLLRGGFAAKVEDGVTYVCAWLCDRVLR